MKKKQFKKKLSLKKETISNLENIKGGGGIISALCLPTVGQRVCATDGGAQCTVNPDTE